MTTHIRPIRPAEVETYLRVLPFANGLPNWEPAPAAWHGGPEAWPPQPAPATPERLAALSEEVLAEGFRSQAAFVDGVLVGGTGMLSLGITIPGGRTAPMGGVTATGVLSTHRRRGLLRAMMRAMFDDAREHGEVLAGLSASEGGIYGRYGFSPATTRTRWELERADAALLDHDPPEGSLELVGAAVARDAWPQVYEQARQHRVGELTPRPDQWAGLSDEADGTNGPLRHLLHRDTAGSIDGIASFRLPWSATIEHTGTLVVEAFEALTPDAYRALWGLLIDFDLTRRVVAPGRPTDEPLRWMLRSPRAMRVTRQSDNLWLRLLNVPAALQMRSYGVPVELTIAVEADPMCPANVGAWHLSAGPDGATCSRTETAPDVSTDIQSLGSLYLGGMSAATLAAAGRIRSHRHHAVADLARAFRGDPEPFNSFGF